MNKEQLKEEFKEALSNKEVLVNAYNLLIEEDEKIINSDDAINERIKTNKGLQEELKEKPEFKKQKDILESLFPTDREELKNGFFKEIETFKEEQTQIIKAVEGKNYNKYIDDLLNNDPLKYSFFTKFYNLFIYYVNKVIEPSDITEEERKKRIEYINYIDDKLTKKYEDAENQKDKFKLDLITMNYPSKEFIRTNKIINDLAIVKNNSFYTSEDYKNALELKDFTFSIDDEAINESTETLNRLDLTDIRVLNLITTIYRKNGIGQYFTNTYIAGLCYEEDPKNVTKEQKEIIHKSIEKLTSTKIKIGQTAEGKKISIYDYLIKITPLKYESKTTTYYYSIDTEPLYHQYLRLTNNEKVIEGKPHNRKLLTDKIKGTKKTKEWEEVRYYLLQQFSLEVNDFTIMLDDIYKIIGLDSKSKNYKTQRIRTRKQLLTIIDRFRQDYKFKFDEEKDTIISSKGTIIGYRIKKIS